jgi:hypothetical protein
MSKENCDSCENGLKSVFEKQKKMIEEQGWFAHLVADDPNLPTKFNAHTHNMDAFGHPDFQIVVPLPGKVLMSILHNVADRVKAGEMFGPGIEYDNLVKGYKVRFIMTTENGTAINWIGENEERLTEDHIVLRMILPSPNGSLYAESMDGPEVYKLQEQCVEINLDEY